jgi:hypothetical protein
VSIPFPPLDTISGSVMGSPDIADAIADVAEGFCPLCRVALITHAGRACCPCGGCSYRLKGERFEMTTSCQCSHRPRLI